MTGRLFDAGESRESSSARRSLRLWGVPVSLAAHIGGAAGLLLLGLAVPEALPPVKAGMHVDGVTLPPVRIKLQAKDERRGGAKRKGQARGGPAVSGLPRIAGPSAPTMVTPLLRVEDLVSEESDWTGLLPPCWRNCGSGPGTGEGEGEGEGDDGFGLKDGDGGGKGLTVHVGWSAPRKLRHVEPVYPALARAAGVQGQVVLECTLDRDGTVHDVRVVRGNPLLNPAAVDAVQQWRYVATLLNGVPVAVVLNVTVNFRLR